MITTMTMKTKESQPPERRSKQLWRQPRLLCKTNFKSAAILSQWQWSPEVSQFYHDFYVMIKSAAILPNINYDQKCRHFIEHQWWSKVPHFVIILMWRSTIPPFCHNAQCAVWAIRWPGGVLTIAVRTLSNGKTIFLRLFFLCSFRERCIEKKSKKN